MFSYIIYRTYPFDILGILLQATNLAQASRPVIKNNAHY